MKIMFLSNFINHHQVGLCDELFKLCGESNFYFIQEENVPENRLRLGYKNDFCNRPYVKHLDDSNYDEIQRLIMETDIIINTFSQGLNLLKQAMKAKKVIFWYQERLFKDYSILKTIAKYFRAKYYFHGNPNQYHLLASSYGYDDMKIISKKWLNHCFEFGYFPITNSNQIIKREIVSSDTIYFLFAGRLIDWKHPEIVFEVSKYLEERNLKYHISIVGSGNMENKLKKKIDERQLSNKVSIIGSVPFSKMVNLYKEHDFFIFASDRREGWGAVLNEAMSYGCVPIANIEAGATLTLIRDKKNGFIYNKGKLEATLNEAIDSKINSLYYEISYNASKTIVDNWNYTVAANKLYELFSYIHNGVKVCSLNDLVLLNYEMQEGTV